MSKNIDLKDQQILKENKIEIIIEKIQSIETLLSLYESKDYVMKKWNKQLLEKVEQKVDNIKIYMENLTDPDYK